MDVQRQERMRAFGIQTYSRPGSSAEALRLLQEGGRPLGGGTRLLAEEIELPHVVDLAALGWAGIRVENRGLVIGAMTRLQDVIDSAESYPTTAGLLPRACRAHSASPILRGMATLGGEVASAAHDSPLTAALLALDASVHRLITSGESARPLAELHGEWAAEGLVESLFIPDASTPALQAGAALEVLAVLPSAPALFSCAAVCGLDGDRIARLRVAITGLEGAPARLGALETELEGRTVEALGSWSSEGLDDLPFREDAHAPAAFRRRVAPVLIGRALMRACERARLPKALGDPPRPWSPVWGPQAPDEARGDRYRLEVTLNGRALAIDIASRTTLLEAVRATGATGTKHGCETGECGACAVLVDGRPIAACMTLAASVAGRRLVTVEGLGEPSKLHAVQQAFVDAGAIQCGFCTPAMELCAAALLGAVSRPSEQEAREALAGCLCRCTGYVKPVEAILAAACARSAT
jgi:aerobic-type carbon monoxide dehydrogenase small subunit (CoxS/CutS family)/CO/xanthine dehydrogenase FAD-binding subunit